MTFTVSLVTYKTPPEVVERLRVASLAEGAAEFIVIDNTVDNVGFGAGHNKALRRAIEEGADFHFIVNPDIAFAPGTMRTLADFLTAHPRVGLVMPKTLNSDGTLQYNCKRCPTPFDLIVKRFLPSRWTRAHLRRFRLERETEADCAFEVPYLCGCFMGFRLSALKEVGLFDERFFMYPEDIDITRRLWSAGWRPTYCPRATVTHAHAAAGYKSARMLAIHIWNIVRYFNKWGWLFDAERRRINAQLEAACRLIRR